MDVTSNRDLNKVIVLGSGMSILDLTHEEKIYINRCKTVIAINKFMPFYKKAGVIPTHIYFRDIMPGAFLFFEYVLKVCRDDGLENLTIITNPILEKMIYNSLVTKIRAVLYNFSVKYRFNYTIKPIIKYLLGKTLSTSEISLLKRIILIFRLPNNSKIIGVNATKWNTGGAWAVNLKQALFHYRGSLTSVLNYISVVYPYQEIFLVGNDFNSSSYFYEEELKSLTFEWKDHTYDMVKKTGIHYSFQNIDGTKMDDKFPFIMDQLALSGNKLYCNNKNSFLVTKSGVDFKPIV
jgi:hypothetical protein